MPVRVMRWAIVGALVLTTAGCAFKASEEECQAACDNVARVANLEVERQIAAAEDLAQSGESGKEMARDMARDLVDAIKSECLKQCNEKGTRERTECLAAAQSVEDLDTCR